MAKSIKENIVNSLTWFLAKLKTTYVTNLASTSDDLALAASQGKALNDTITTLYEAVLKGAKGTTTYYGVVLPGGGDTDWLRTTSSGIIPYSADSTNGKSSLGTSTWPFATVYAKTIYEGGTALGSKYLALSGGTVTGTLTLSKTADADAATAASPALIVGGTSTTAHIQIDSNEIIAKGDGTTAGTLYLNSGSGLVYANNNMVGRLTATPTSGQLVIADGTTGGLKTSGYTTGSFAAASHTHSYAASNHTHTSVQDANSTGNATTFCYSMAGLNYADYTWLAAWNGYQLRAVNKNQFATASHTHSYLPLTGGTVTGSTTFNGSSATITISAATTYLNGTNIWINDWSGTGRRPIAAVTSNGYRISCIQCNASVLPVYGQWGTANASFTAKNVAVASSDIRLKTDIGDCLVEAMPVIRKLNLHSFTWTDRTEDTHQNIGFVADEIDQIDHRFSVGGGYDEDGVANYKSIDTLYMLGYVVKGMQEMDARIEELETRIKELESK